MKAVTEQDKAIKALVASGLTPVQAQKAWLKLQAETDLMIYDPKTGRTEPLPVGPSIFD